MDRPRLNWLNLDWLNLDWLPAAQRWLQTGLADGIGAGGDVATALALGLVFGALHALMPGHGKSLLVSYHLGRDGTWLDGLKSASLLAATHIGLAVLLVLTGMAVVGGIFARDDPAYFETASAVAIALIGCYLVYRAIRPHAHREAGTGRLLALAAGAVPCPLTVFILTFAIVKDRTGVGLVAIAAMLLGAIATLSVFAVGAVLTRGRLIGFLERSTILRARIGRGLELAGAVGVLAIGLLMLFARAATP